jgi:hypothetical protein
MARNYGKAVVFNKAANVLRGQDRCSAQVAHFHMGNPQFPEAADNCSAFFNGYMAVKITPAKKKQWISFRSGSLGIS